MYEFQAVENFPTLLPIRFVYSDTYQTYNRFTRLIAKLLNSEFIKYIV